MKRKTMDMNKFCRRASSREGKDGMLAIRGRKGECSGREFYDPNNDSIKGWLQLASFEVD